jgi:hypothetical protein
MNYLGKLANNIMYNGKKKKVKMLKNYWGLAIVGIAIGGTAVAIITKKCYEEIKNIVIRNAGKLDEDINEDIDEDIDEEINEGTEINKAEIKETLVNLDEKSIGAVGLAMEDAMDDLEDINQNENEVKS